MEDIMEDKGDGILEGCDPGQDATGIVLGIVMHIDLQRVIELKRFLKKIDARIVYQRLSSGKLWIMEGEEPPAEMGH